MRGVSSGDSGESTAEVAGTWRSIPCCFGAVMCLVLDSGKQHGDWSAEYDRERIDYNLHYIDI